MCQKNPGKHFFAIPWWVSPRDDASVLPPFSPGKHFGSIFGFGFPRDDASVLPPFSPGKHFGLHQEAQKPRQIKMNTFLTSLVSFFSSYLLTLTSLASNLSLRIQLSTLSNLDSLIFYSIIFYYIMIYYILFHYILFHYILFILHYMRFYYMR